MQFCSWPKLLHALRRARSRPGPRPTFRAVLEPLEDRRLLATLTVVNTSDSGPGSFRQAILDSNTSVGVVDTIAFNIPGGGVQTIAPASALPAVTDPVTINGTTQPGFAGSPLVVINGAGAGAKVTGLTIT